MKCLVVLALAVLCCCAYASAYRPWYARDVKNRGFPTEHEDPYGVYEYVDSDEDDDDEYTSSEESEEDDSDDSDEHHVVRRDVADEINRESEVPNARSHPRKVHRARAVGRRAHWKRASRYRSQGSNSNNQGIENRGLIFGVCLKLKMIQKRSNETEQALPSLGSEVEPLQNCCNQMALARVRCFEQYVADQCAADDSSNNSNDEDEDNDEDAADDASCCTQDSDDKMSCVLAKVKASLKSQLMGLKQQSRGDRPARVRGRRVRTRNNARSN